MVLSYYEQQAAWGQTCCRPEAPKFCHSLGRFPTLRSCLCHTLSPGTPSPFGHILQWSGHSLGGARRWDRPTASSVEKQTPTPPHSPKGIYCHLSESFLVFLVFPLTFCHIHTLLKPYGKSASCRELGSKQLHCPLLYSRAEGTPGPAWCPVPTRKRISPAPVLVRPQEQEDRGGKEGTWRLKLLTPCLIGVMPLRGPCRSFSAF